MKNHLYKAALVAALGLVGTVAAQAQYSAPTGSTIAANDLVLGFTSPDATSVGGVAYDYVIDLGQLLGDAPGQVNISTATGYSASTFTADLGSATTSGELYAGVFGGKDASAGDVLMSQFGTVPTPNTSSFGRDAAGSADSPALGAVAQTGESVYEDISEAPGADGAAANSFASYLGGYSPLTTISSAVGTGTGTETFNIYESTWTLTGSPTSWTDEGYVSVLFGSNGGIDGVAWDEAATQSAVPEPATYGIFGGIGVLLLGVRRQLIGKLA